VSLISIRDEFTGIVRVYDDKDEWHGDYIWDEGNYSCDCNRHLFFQWAAGVDTDVLDDEDPLVDHPCSTDHYSVRITTPEGVLLYEDGEWPASN
jgi:hypothetical protein